MIKAFAVGFPHFEIMGVLEHGSTLFVLEY